MVSANKGAADARRGAWIVGFCCLASLAEGIDLQAPGVTLPVLGPLFQLESGEGGGFLAGFFSQRSLFLSMSTFGLLLGALIGGRLSDKIGRKWVMAASVALFGIFSGVTAHSTSGDMLLWMRFLTGLGLGGCYANMIAISVENVGAERRNTAVGVLYAAMPLGGALVSLASSQWATPEHWRNVYYLGALIPLLALPGIILGVPNTKPAPVALDRTAVGTALFGEGRAIQTGVLWLCFLTALITQYIILSWLPSLLVAKGLPKPQAPLCQMAFNLLSVPGAILAGMLIDRPLRRLAIPAVFAAGIVSLAILAVVPAELMVSLAAAGLVGLTASGAQAIMYALAPAVYPTHVRGTGVGFALAIGRLGAATGPLLAGAMLGAGLPPTHVLGVMAPLLLLAGLCAWYLGLTTAPVQKSVEPAAA